VSKAAKRERQKQNRELARVERERMVKRQRQMRTLRTLALLLAPLVVIGILIAVFSGGGDDDSSEVETTAPKTPAICENPVADPQREFAEAPPMTINPEDTYTATLCTSEGVIEMDLDATNAPVATNNFVFLASEGFYDGLTFHRAAENFVIQGGDPAGNGSGGPGYTVAGEVPTDNYPLGALAAAKSGDEPAGTFGSQFFIVTGDGGASLPNDYARFGSVTKGIKVAQKIEKYAPDNGDGEPTKKTTIDKIVIKVNGTVMTPSTTTPPATEAAPSSTSTP
jgi:peptidyl-prolyl cis-trans isomerase B (cyclophilin B)